MKNTVSCGALERSQAYATGPLVCLAGDRVEMCLQALGQSSTPARFGFWLIDCRLSFFFRSSWSAGDLDQYRSAGIQRDRDHYGSPPQRLMIAVTVGARQRGSRVRDWVQEPRVRVCL
jgi:hypothetical protein